MSDLFMIVVCGDGEVLVGTWLGNDTNNRKLCDFVNNNLPNIHRIVVLWTD
jgi:hypothetical protein